MRKKLSFTKIAEIDSNFTTAAAIQNQLLWRDVGDFSVQAQGWPSKSDRWTRLPVQAQERVRPSVWNLSRCSTGLYLEFKTDSSELGARWTVGRDELSMNHMPATGVSGLDLYEWDGTRWRWAATGRPNLERDRNFETTFFERREHLSRRFRLYFPLYNSLIQLELGMAPDSELRVVPEDGRFIVVYGSSIVQGGCASRPGMAYPAILGRNLAIPVVNLGFSGNAHAEPELAALLADLRPEMLVIDCLPNIQSEGCEEVLRVFLEVLARSGCKSPLLFVDFPNFPKAFVSSPYSAMREKVRKSAKCAFNEMRGNLSWHWLAGDRLLGDDLEATVDGIHPTDLGFQRMASVIGQAIEAILKSVGRHKVG